jgi:hypothetical protein
MSLAAGVIVSVESVECGPWHIVAHLHTQYRAAVASIFSQNHRNDLLHLRTPMPCEDTRVKKPAQARQSGLAAGESGRIVRKGSSLRDGNNHSIKLEGVRPKRIRAQPHVVRKIFRAL